MKTILIMLSAALFLLCSTVGFPQQTYTVDIPGIDTYIFYDGSSGYGSEDNELKVGKNSNTYRCYITWNNILSYVPAGSEVTNVEFYITWEGNGSSSAQIEFRDFVWTVNLVQRYANIGSGTLWGTLPATTVTYSFAQLTERVQNIVNGIGSSPVRLGIKNQNESSSDYYVSYLYNICLRVSYLGSSVNVTQVDEQGNPFGQVGRWLNNDWDYINVPFSLDLQSGANLGMQSDTTYKSGTYQKYFEWTQNSEVSIPNHHNFTVQTGGNELIATFKTSDEGVDIKNSLEATGIDGGSVEFADPWLIDFPDPDYGYTERNRGMKQTGDDALTFYQRESPFSPDYDTYYKGVFLDQSGPGSGWQGAYYKVGMPTEQTISINGQNRKFYPYKWTGNSGVTFQNEYHRQTGAVFTSNTAVATAVLKGQLMSNDQNGISSNSQRKIVRTDNGRYHVVYESMGTVFYTYSLTSNFYGAWSPDEILDNHGKNPAIEFDADIVKIVFEEYNPQVGGDAKIWLYTFTPNGYGIYYLWYTETVADYPNSYYGSAKPAISYNNRQLFIAYRTSSNGAMKQRTKWYNTSTNSWFWVNEEDIPETNGDSKNPAVIGSIGNIHIAYESFGSIKYKYGYIQGYSWRYRDVVYLSAGCGFTNNYSPAISISDGMSKYVMVSWLGIYGASIKKISLKEQGSLPQNREAAVAKVGWGTSWGTFSNFGNNVDFTNNGSLNTLYGSIMAWSESDGQYSKYVRRRNPFGYDAITALSSNGIQTMVSNGSELGNMKAMVFNASTNAPYLINRCTNDFTYIPDLGKIGETEFIDISFGRTGVVGKNGLEFVFNIGDVLLNGNSIKFIERVDTIPVTSIEELNASVITDTLSLNSQSELIFSDYYYVVNAEKADSLLSNDFNVNFKCELVKLSNGEVVGVFEQVNYNKNNLEEYGYQGYLIDCSGIETGDYYLRLITNVNEEVDLSLSDIQLDDVLLEKSNLQVRNFKGENIPLEYSLEQNYPNPFNPSTTIKYQIPSSGIVTLRIYDILGSEVTTLVDEFKTEGRYEINFNASSLASGVYLYRINVNDYVDVKKMMLLK